MYRKLMVTLLVVALAITMTSTILFAAAAIDVPVAELTPAKKTAFDAIDRNAKQIGDIGTSIFSFSELGLQEFETNKLMTGLLKEWGFKIENGISGMPTAFMATYGSGKPVIVVHTESDCVPSASQRPGSVFDDPLVTSGDLRGPGHGEGHNEGPATMLGAAYAVKQAMDKYNLKGTLKIFLSPAEEQLVARPFFARDGYFDDADIAFHPHVSSSSSASYGLRQYALVSIEYKFFGKTAHGASAWGGNDAADAAKLMSIGFDALREHLPPTYRAMSTMVQMGDQPNVITSFAKIWWMYREASAELVKDIWAKGNRVAEGAAMMTNTRVEENLLSAVWPSRANETVSRVVYANIKLVGMPKWSAEEQEMAKAIQKFNGADEIGLRTEIGSFTKRTSQSASANDEGDVTWVLPSSRIPVPGGISGTIGHHWSAAIGPGTSVGEKGEVTGAKYLAGAMIDFLEHPELAAEAKATHAEEVAGTEYVSLMPLDQKAPTFLNKESAARWKPLLEPFYYRPDIEFK